MVNGTPEKWGVTPRTGARRQTGSLSRHGVLVATGSPSRARDMAWVLTTNLRARQSRVVSRHGRSPKLITACSTDARCAQPSTSALRQGPVAIEDLCRDREIPVATKRSNSQKKISKIFDLGIWGVTAHDAPWISEIRL